MLSTKVKVFELFTNTQYYQAKNEFTNLIRWIANSKRFQLHFSRSYIFQRSNIICNLNSEAYIKVWIWSGGFNDVDYSNNFSVARRIMVLGGNSGCYELACKFRNFKHVTAFYYTNMEFHKQTFGTYLPTDQKFSSRNWWSRHHTVGCNCRNCDITDYNYK